MKFVMVIANEEYQTQIEDIFRHLQCSATKIASTGDFLQYGEVIYLLGIDSSLIDKLRSMCAKLFDEEQNVVNHMCIYEMRIDQFIKCGGGRNTDDRKKTESTGISVEESREHMDKSS